VYKRVCIGEDMSVNYRSFGEMRGFEKGKYKFGVVVGVIQLMCLS